MKFNWDWKHSLIMVGSTLAGATLGFLESQQPGTIIDAFSSWTAFKPELHGMLVVDIAALIALAKQSFLPSTTAGGGK